MDTQWVIFGAILIANTFFSVAVAVYIASKYVVPGRNALIFMLAALSVWSFAYAMITFSTDMEVKNFWLRIENIGILFQPTFWFIFILGYFRNGKELKWYYTALLCLIPAISLGLIFSDNWFHFYYSSVMPLKEGIGPLVIKRGPWYWVALTQAYALDLIGMALLVWRLIQFQNIFKKQLSFLIFAALIPLIINVMYQLIANFSPAFFPPVDLTPISFTLSVSLISSGIFRSRLLDLIPIARDLVMEHIPEMVFVVDAHDRVLDVNTVAEKWLGVPHASIIGKDPIEIFGKWPELYNRFLTTEKTREEVLIPGDPSLTLEVVITPLYDEKSKELSGRIILAYDVTKHKLMETELKARITEIDLLRVQLQEQAIRDPLTGAFNRRYFSEALDQEAARSARENTPFSILILDVDHFKQFNDTYGHKCGDIVLQALATFLNENTRQGDIVCRYGGEEFVILMTDVASEDAYKRAERFRKQFEETVIEYEGKELKCTFSAGIASYPAHDRASEILLTLADQALYRSKASGRNRTTLYSLQDQYQIPDN